jgi:hypothetical protein
MKLSGALKPHGVLISSMGVISSAVARPPEKRLRARRVAPYATVDSDFPAALAAFTGRPMRTAHPWPLGASILHAKTGEVLLRAFDAVRQESGPSAHLEVRAIRPAAKRLKQISPAGCTLHTTCEPCPMCMSAALRAGLDRAV